MHQPLNALGNFGHLIDAQRLTPERSEVEQMKWKRILKRYTISAGNTSKHTRTKAFHTSHSMTYCVQRRGDQDCQNAWKKHDWLYQKAHNVAFTVPGKLSYGNCGSSEWITFCCSSQVFQVFYLAQSCSQAAYIQNMIQQYNKWQNGSWQFDKNPRE